MDGGGGGGGGEDRLSLLPDEVLGGILGRLPSTIEATRTSLLSRRWRRVWLAIPAFNFVDPGDSTGRISSFLAAYTAQTDLPVHGIYVITTGAPADSTGESLHHTARCLSGELSRVNEAPAEDEEGLAVERESLSCPASRMPPRFICSLGFSASGCLVLGCSDGSP